MKVGKYVRIIKDGSDYGKIGRITNIPLEKEKIAIYIREYGEAKAFEETELELIN